MFGTRKLDEFLEKTIYMSSMDQAVNVDTSRIRKQVAYNDTYDPDAKVIYIGRDVCCAVVRVSPDYVSLNNYRYTLSSKDVDDEDLLIVQVCLISLLLALQGYHQDQMNIWKDDVILDDSSCQKRACGLTDIYSILMGYDI